MKISGMPVQTSQKAPENTAGKAVVPEIKEEREDDAVVLNVSQRNAISAGDDGTSMDAGFFPDLLQKLTANPESTSQLHASLSPERVLQLLA